jgi:hypothetical protein
MREPEQQELGLVRQELGLVRQELGLVRQELELGEQLEDLAVAPTSHPLEDFPMEIPRQQKLAQSEHLWGQSNLL